MKEGKPKLAVVLSRYPWPLDKGDKLRAFEQIKQFSQSFEVHIFCLIDQRINNKNMDIKELKDVKVHCYYLPKYLSLLNVFLSLFGSLPLQVAYFHNYFIKKRIQADIRSYEAQHIYCQLIRMSEYVKNMHDIPKTLDYMDAFSKGIERRIKSTPTLFKWVFKIEWKRLMRYESSVFDYFDNRTIISNQDKKEILHPKNNEILCVPNGVRSDFHLAPKNDQKYDAVFVGNLNYPPNIQAIDFTVNQILPLIHKTNPTFTFAAFGAHPSARLLEYGKKKGVSIFGWVEDIRMAYTSGKVFLAPMFIGTGLQNKLLEAMALGIPCVTTPLAGLPLGATNKLNILLAENPSEFECQIKLLNDSSIKEPLVQNAKKHIVAFFDWQTVTKPITELMLRN